MNWNAKYLVIISSVIQHHEPIWGEFCAEHERDFDSLFARYQKHQIFVDAQGELDTAIVGCFPLHPVSTFILPRLSERVAQNERTLFTFLSADGAATLPAFINTHNRDKFWLITPDQIYDYFEPLFMKEVYSGDIHDTYILTSNILAQLDENTLGAKIVKTLSLIYILEQFERLSPTKEQIIGIYSAEYSVDEIETAISDLVEKEYVVYIKRSNDYLRLKQTSGVDIQQKIRDQVESLSLRIAVKDVLNNSNFDNYMYPSRYNDEREIARPLSQRTIDKLSRYGVTVIFRISSEEDSTYFFKQLLDRTTQNPPNEIEQFLERFSSVQFSVLTPNDNDSRYFLFQENMVWKNFKNHVVTIPAYSIKRDVYSEMVEYFSTNDALSFISGNFYSGKTFSLLEAARLHSDKKVYIFPSGTKISDAQLAVLLEKENALSCFDT